MPCVTRCRHPRVLRLVPELGSRYGCFLVLLHMGVKQMTTPVPWERIIEIKDRNSLKLVSRVFEAQITIAEGHLAQLKELKGAIDERLKTLK